MNNQMPRTPFSTPLSGSAKETELRLKNIFSGPKKRPPVLFLALMFSVCIFCGNLVSCQVADAEGDGLRPGDTSLQENLDPFAALNEKEEALLQALFQAANEQEAFQVPEARLLNTLYGDGCVLGVAFVTDHLENTLILGVMDTETKELTGPIFRCGQHTGVLKTAVFSNHDGEQCLLYTFTGQMMGQYRGEAGVIRLDGDSIVWEWPVEGDIRDEAGTAREEYENYWNGHLALIAPGGVDIYEVNPDFAWGKEEPASMWQISGDELFYSDPSSAAELPMPVYFQALNWLVGYTNDPGGWRIASLKPNAERANPEIGRKHPVPDSPETQTDCFTLTACMDDGTGEFTADLFFSYEQEGGRRSYGGLEHAVVRDRKISPADAASVQTGQLPLDEPEKLWFGSGAGAWSTILTLYPDGSFEGDYTDADMDTQYVCRFHGRFTDITQLTGASWSLTLEELVLDTKYPVGEEWNEDGIHYISSEPYGFDDGDHALTPGAQFTFYTPEASASGPNSELYRMENESSELYEFWTWWPQRYQITGSSETLNCCALHNITSGYGFFDFHSWGIE